MKLISFIFFLFLFDLQVSNNWELKQTDEEINIYTRDVVGSCFKEFKADAIIDAPIASILALIKNEEDYTNWNYRTNHAIFLKKETNSSIVYAISTAPWPVKDRDIVLEYSYKIDKTKQTVLIATKTIPDLVPKKKKMVRISKNKGSMILERLNKSQTKLTLQIQAEPGGGIPAWMANFASTDTPYFMITQIRKLVKQERYQNANLEELK